MTGYSTEGFTRDEYLIDGVRSIVHSAGKGPTVVFFHGGGTFHGFEWARDWLDRFHVILPYHPGFGECADDPDITSTADYVMHYTALFAALGLTRFGLSARRSAGGSRPSCADAPRDGEPAGAGGAGGAAGAGMSTAGLGIDPA